MASNVACRVRLAQREARVQMTVENSDNANNDAAVNAVYYDRYWSADSQPHYEVDESLRGLIERNVGSSTRCLDVGCGAGASYARWVEQHSSSYVGVDVSARAVALAGNVGLDALLVKDSSELPFADESFDTVICIEVFEHLFAPQETAREIRRVLRPRGVLIASAPNAVYWRLRANLLFGMWNPLGDELSAEQPWRDPHLRFFSPQTLQRMLVWAGFTHVEVSAHDGRLLDHLTRRPTSFGEGRFYRAAERRLPSLLGLTIHSVATK